MTLSIRELTPGFAAEVEGADLAGTLDDADFAAIQDAIDRYGVLVFHEQPLTDEQQVAFSARFGKLEQSININRDKRPQLPEISDISNVDASGDRLGTEARKVYMNLGNEHWHSDSSFKPVPARYSLLSAREIPPEGGETEFANTRAGYETWPGSEAGIAPADLEGLVCEHSIVYSRMNNTGDIFDEQEKAKWHPVRQAMIRTNPTTGRKSVLVGSHCSHVIGWPVEKGRALIAELNAWCTQPRFVFRHTWRQLDLVIWDNRAVMHRGLPFDRERYRRVMHRTTVAGEGPTAPQE